MKKIAFVFNIVFGILVCFPLAIPAEAKVVKPVKAVSVSKTKKAATAVKKKKIVVKKKTKSFAKNAFSASAASNSVSPAGKTPPAGYMEALNKALNNYLAAKSAARGNKAKLQAAEDGYNQDLADAQALLGQ